MSSDEEDPRRKFDTDLLRRLEGGSQVNYGPKYGPVPLPTQYSKSPIPATDLGPRLKEYLALKAGFEAGRNSSKDVTAAWEEYLRGRA